MKKIIICVSVVLLSATYSKAQTNQNDNNDFDKKILAEKMKIESESKNYNFNYYQEEKPKANPLDKQFVEADYEHSSLNPKAVIKVENNRPASDKSSQIQFSDNPQNKIEPKPILGTNRK